MDRTLDEFAAAVGTVDPVSIEGSGSRGGRGRGGVGRACAGGHRPRRRGGDGARVRRRHDDGRRPRRARRGRPDRVDPRRRHDRRCTGQRCQRHHPPRARPDARRAAADPFRRRVGQGHQGRWSHGEERQRLRPVPAAGRVVGDTRVLRRRARAHTPTASLEPLVLDRGRPVRVARDAVSPRGDPVGRRHDVGPPRRRPPRHRDHGDRRRVAGRRGSAGAPGSVPLVGAPGRARRSSGR